MKRQTPFTLGLITILLVILFTINYNDKSGGNGGETLTPDTPKDPIESNYNQLMEQITPGMSPVEIASILYSQKLKINGIVLDQNNQPVADALLKYSFLGVRDLYEVWVDSDSPVDHFTKSDGEGRFLLEGIGGSFYTRFVSHPECVSTSVGGLKISVLDKLPTLYGISPDNPVEIRVFRTGKKFPLYKYRANSLWLRVDHSKSYFLDFKKSRLGEQATQYSLPIRLIGSLYGSSLEHLGDKSYKYGIEIGDQGHDVQIAPARKDDYKIAPLKGYQDSQILGEITDSEKKVNHISSSYFVKFGDNTHGYVELRTTKHKVHFALLYNPKPDSRNLNFDREIAIVEK